MRTTAILCTIVLLLMSGCTFNPRQSVTVFLDGEHLWEYYAGESMWHTLTWFDGSTIRSRTLGKNMRSTTVEVEMGRTCVFAAYPLDSLRPMGAVYSPGDGAEVSLDFSQGRLADLLLDVADYNARLVSCLSYDELSTHLVEDWDEDALYAAFLDGTVGSGKVEKADFFKVEVEGLVSGHYVSEYDEGPEFDAVYGETVELELMVGIHRFYNMEKDFVHVVAIYPDGEASYYSYRLPLW